MNRAAAGALVLLLAGGLQACCFRDRDTGGNDDAAAGPRGGPADTLDIVNWGPRETTAGVPFNVQPGGHAAIWIQLDEPLDGQPVLVQLGGAFLEGQASDRLVTAMVPEASYARRGVYEVRVVAGAADARRDSNTVLFKVE